MGDTEIMIKRFATGWIIGGILFVIISCVKQKELIVAVFRHNMWNWINAVMPLAIIVFGICFAIKCAFGSR